ncbi:DUF6541 family protein [Leucobacter luti]|uniref:4-amino-4-deoxy-L-arabinose transferase-like glycosyltransferase n=1 Tax=Leucobacter luti TaxID=340320 RepID=A0A4Q7TS76_9MICO|nr:DUF6541 family protein [Leucobacter luti]MBL3699731.1 hypothetical protein [Leucobacter luti]RZT62947.1 hypothetical protein EV139_2656 [Leucobacter luti]
MIAWIAFVAPAAAALLVIALLGLPAALALRLRGFAIPLVAVPAAFAVLALSSIAAPIAGVPWSLVPALALALVLAGALFLLRRWLGAPAAPRAGRTQRGELWLGLGAAAIGGAVIAVSLAAGLRSPDAVSQTFDANFHLNTVRYLLDSGSASPFTMELTTPGAPVFYPTLWHSFVALVVQLTGASIPAATNAVLLAVSAVIWPIGAVALGRAVAGPSTRVTVIAGVLSAAFPNFPLFLAGYGVIYPNILSLALLPYLLVGLLQLLNLGPARRALALAPGTRWLLTLGALGAAVLAHPNAIHTALAWAAVPVLWAAARALLARPVPNAAGLLAASPLPLWWRRFGAVLGALAFVGAVGAAWVLGRSTDNAWQGFYGPRSAALQLIGGTPHLEGHAWAVALIVLIGAILAWRHRSLRWVLGSAAVLAVLYLVADGFHTSDWRTAIVGPWYNDPRRLASLVPFGALPLAVLGASALWVALRPGLRRLARISSARPLIASRVFAVVAVLLLLAAGQAGSLSAMQAVKASYNTKLGMLLDDDERALLDRIDEEVPAGDVIANNPLNGSSLSYAISDRAVLFPHGSGAYDPRAYALVDSLVAAPGDACVSAAELNVHFVLDFGTDYIFEDAAQRGVPFKRMKHLDRSPILTEIDREGDAVLYQITGC